RGGGGRQHEIDSDAHRDIRLPSSAAPPSTWGPRSDDWPSSPLSSVASLSLAGKVVYVELLHGEITRIVTTYLILHGRGALQRCRDRGRHCRPGGSTRDHKALSGTAPAAGRKRRGIGMPPERAQ